MRQATGELRTLADGWAARITIAGRTRRDFVLATCGTEPEARERCTALATIASRLRAAEQTGDLVKLLEMGAKARAGRPWDAVCAAVDALCAGKVQDKRAAKVPTVKDFAADWTSGRLHAKYPDHVGRKKESSVARDEGIADKYVTPHIGDLLVCDVQLADCELVMANVPASLSSSSRRQVAQFLAKLLGYAVYPCRFRESVPVPRGWLPKIGKPKAMQWVRPDEDAAHMGNVALPLWRRLFFGVDRREGMRVDELASLRWSDVDLALGAVRLDVNKTDVPRAWALSPDVAEALRRWKPKGAEPGDFVFVDESGHRIDVQHLAEAQREDLHASGVTRPELHHDGPNRRKLRARRPRELRHGSPRPRQERDVGGRPDGPHDERHDQPLPARGAHLGRAGAGHVGPPARGPSRAFPGCYGPGPSVAGQSQFPTECPTKRFWCGSQVVRQRIANPLHVGSNPIRTSSQIPRALGATHAP